MPIGKKLLGLFVVQDDDPPGLQFDGPAPPKTPPAPRADDIDINVELEREAAQVERFAQGSGVFDFDAVLLAAGVSTEEKERVTKTLSLLKSLPAGTPPEVQRQIVAASLQAFGIPVDKIIESALAVGQALEHRIQASDKERAAEMEAGNRRILELNAELERVNKELRDIVSRHQAVVHACRLEQEVASAIPDFFGPEATEAARATSARLRS